MMNLPEPAYYTIKMLAERLTTTEEKIEQYLREGSLFASVYIQQGALYEADDFTETPKYQGGIYEIADYRNIKWDGKGDCDFLHQQVGLRKLAGDALQYQAEWVKSGKRRSLRYAWRLNAYGHKVFLPISQLMINRRDVFVELSEVQSFEEEHKASADQKQSTTGSGGSENQPKKRGVQSGAEKEKAIKMAEEEIAQKREKEEKVDWNDIAPKIQEEVKRPTGGEFTERTIKAWIKHLLADKERAPKKSGRPKK